VGRGEKRRTEALPRPSSGPAAGGQGGARGLSACTQARQSRDEYNRATEQQKVMGFDREEGREGGRERGGEAM